jgi:hypothetical protein
MLPLNIDPFDNLYYFIAEFEFMPSADIDLHV